MDLPPSMILIPYTYFEWKLKVLLLRRKRFCQITMETKEKPNSTIDKAIFFNIVDEAFELFWLSIYKKLLHIESASTPNEVWNTWEGLFKIQDQ
jgi:hypothetical protein